MLLKSILSLEFFHSLFTVSILLYSLSLHAVPSEIDLYFKSKMMGYGSFATIWILYFTIATFITRMAFLIFPVSILKYTFGFLFPLSYSYSFIISLLYWPILYLNYSNFYPKFENDVKMPITTDLCYHLVPLISLYILKRLISKRDVNNNSNVNKVNSNSNNDDDEENSGWFKKVSCKNIKSLINIFINITFIFLTGLVYQMLTNFVFYKTNTWPYPFMEKFGFITVNLMIFGGIFITSIIYLIIK